MAEGDEWVRKADIPTPRWGMTVSAVNGKIYAIGGSLGNSSRLKTMEEYDPAADKWTQKEDMLESRFFPCVCSVDGKIYVLGGATAFPMPLATVEEYTPDGWPFAVSVEGKLATTWGDIKQ